METIKKGLRFISMKLHHAGLFLPSKSLNPIRWGIVGLGHMAEVFANAIDGSKGGIVYAVASRSIEKAIRFSNNHGHCKAYGSYDDMINDESLKLDVIYIATPVAHHYEIIKSCLLAGHSVLCEKPITCHSFELEELIRISRENDCFLMEGMWMKCLPTFRKAVEWVEQGRIGPLSLIRVDFYKREHIDEKLAIFSEKECGGVIRDYGVYAIAFMTHFLGGIPDTISCISRNSYWGIDSDWGIFASKNGIHSIVNLSSDFGGESRASLIGETGFIEWEPQFNRSVQVSLYDVRGERVDSYKVRYKYDGFEHEVDEVHNCIRRGQRESKSVDLESSLSVARVVDYLLEQK